MTQRVATAVGPRGSGTTPDPWADPLWGSIPLHRGRRLDFRHPRGAMELIWEQNFDAHEEYPPYWAELWPSGIELAHAVSARVLDGASVLELGCGLGLPAIAAALSGGRVLATDRAPDSIAFTAANAHLNGVGVDTAVCAWGEPGALLDRAPFDLVLASDVLYGHRHVTELLDLLPRLVDDGGEVWIADPGRPLAEEFLVAARERWRTVSTTSTRVPTVQIHTLRGLPRAA